MFRPGGGVGGSATVSGELCDEWPTLRRCLDGGLDLRDFLASLHGSEDLACRLVVGFFVPELEPGEVLLPVFVQSFLV